MKSIDNLLKNGIPLGHAFNVLLVDNNIRKVAQIEYNTWSPKGPKRFSEKTIKYLKNFLTENNINYIENGDTLIIYNNKIKIDPKKLSDDKYNSHYVGKILDIACAKKNFSKNYKRKTNSPFQVRFMVQKYNKDGYLGDTDMFMAQMCLNAKTFAKSHKQLTKFQKELEKKKLDFFRIYMEADPQPMYYGKYGPVYYKK